jgi:lysophospholipase-1
MMQSVKYVVSLIDDLVAKGVPEKRIVLAGFSQGHAMTLLTGLTSKYAGRLGGLVALSGYLPVADRIKPLRKDASLPLTVGGDVPIFLARGTNDMLVPKRYGRLQLEKLKELGVPDSAIETHEYQDMGHSVSPRELADVLTFLEKIIPAIE